MQWIHLATVGNWIIVHIRSPGCNNGRCANSVEETPWTHQGMTVRVDLARCPCVSDVRFAKAADGRDYRLSRLNQSVVPANAESISSTSESTYSDGVDSGRSYVDGPLGFVSGEAGGVGNETNDVAVEVFASRVEAATLTDTRAVGGVAGGGWKPSRNAATSAPVVRVAPGPTAPLTSVSPRKPNR